MCRASCNLTTMSAVLAALALVALMPAALGDCEPEANVPLNCTLWAKQNNDRLLKISERCVSMMGRPVDVTLYWGSDPARAAATLLRVLLRDVLRYRRVRTAQGPHNTAELSTHVTFDPTGRYTELVIGVSTAWEPKEAPPWFPYEGQNSGLAGPRLVEFGTSPVTARRRLHAWLAPAARSRGACLQLTNWTSYFNVTALTLCDFVDGDAALNYGNKTAAEVLGVGDCNVTLKQLSERARASALPLRMRHVTRAELLRAQRAGNHSFLFLDYDIWQGESGISIVVPPPCVSTGSVCQQELDSVIAIRVADVEELQKYAPELFQFVNNDFKPTAKSLRRILEQETNGLDIEEAVCEWALQEKYIINSPNMTNYYIYVFFCENDPDENSYTDIISLFFTETVEPQITEVGYNLTQRIYYINCSDAHSMSKMLDARASYVGFRKVLGVVSHTVVGAETAAATASSKSVPLLFVDVVPDKDESTTSTETWRVAARPRHVARALQRFVLEAGWTRVAVLSEPTPLAENYFNTLKEDAHFVLQDNPIKLNLTELQANEVLEKLQDSNARIVFVNADSEAAVVILTEAFERKMSFADGFVWIVRDWRPNNATSYTTHFTVSPWSRREEGIPHKAGQAKFREHLNAMWPNRMWPPHAMSLANALLTLWDGFKDVFLRNPSTPRHDLHTTQVISSFNKSLVEKPVTGVSQLLQYKDGSIEETFVYVDEWRGDVFTRLATWRVNATSGAVRGNDSERAVYVRAGALPSDDGASKCLARGGDDFDPACYDAAWICALLLLALIPAALLLARHILRRHFARLLEKEMLARRRHVNAVLPDYLVERDALELHHEIGAGRFGSVRLALLRVPNHEPRYVAAKALRANAAPAEESEFLREACTIASLDHTYIVRLVGVCITDGPPLVLMELAFFGDLLGYLRARRHLVESAGSDTLTGIEEAAHVSAKALTRLAREAAEALKYLSSRGVVHRDVRAANCLVDARRSLKLADFGMARDTVASADGAPEYACRRRGLFPVLWMAPESLAHGVFSAASDVWALGVLVLELVTLGARPYGSMSPLRVLEYVAAGRRPPLPLDTTPQTRGLARLCWQRAAERRPSAAEVAAYLAARPLALQPALLIHCDEPTADRGSGESTKLLPPESPLDSIDLLEVSMQ